MLMLIVLIVVGVAVIALSVAVLLRSRGAAEALKTRELGLESGEREVYERLYGKRATTVSDPMAVERPPEGDARSGSAGL